MMYNNSKLKVFSGRANIPLGKEIARCLGDALGKITLDNFPDGETSVRIDEDVGNLVDQTVRHFGRLDVAVNNAGTEGQPGPLTGQSRESYAARRRCRTSAPGF